MSKWVEDFMATRYRFGDNSLPHFITFEVLNWIDVVVDSLKYCIEEKGLILHAWVIMTNHVHLIASAKSFGSRIIILSN